MMLGKSTDSEVMGWNIQKEGMTAMYIIYTYLYAYNWYTIQLYVIFMIQVYIDMLLMCMKNILELIDAFFLCVQML